MQGALGIGVARGQPKGVQDGGVGQQLEGLAQWDRELTPDLSLDPLEHGECAS